MCFRGDQRGGMPLLFSRILQRVTLPPETLVREHRGSMATTRRRDVRRRPVCITVFAINQITPAATIDEGNNWINLGYGPLSLVHPVTSDHARQLRDRADFAGRGRGNSIWCTQPRLLRKRQAAGQWLRYRSRGDRGYRSAAAGDSDADRARSLQPGQREHAWCQLESATTGTGNIPGLLCGLTGVPAPCANIRVNTNQALSVTLTGLTAFAHWNGAGSVFGSRQAAAVTFVNAPGNNTALTLKETGGTTLNPANFIRVLYTTGGGGTITIQTTTNSGGTYTDAGATITGFGGLAANDILTAFVDQNGVVYVWKNTTFIGSRTPTANALWSTGGGRIGMQLPNNNNRVDNFAGGTVP